MPGVPSGRACEGCRLQKKKCDCAKPSCSRCTRLNLPCVGSGERRFIFSGLKCARRKPSLKETIHLDEPKHTTTISRAPSHAIHSLIGEFLCTIKSSTDARYNLAGTYGEFLHGIPRRLGHSDALDAATKALVNAHSDMCSQQAVSVRSLTAYSEAIAKLRVSLKDPARAHTVDVAGTVIILMICSSLNGFDRQHSMAHCEGAADILSARKRYKQRDEFEDQLLLTLRVPLLLQGILNRNSRLFPSKGKGIVDESLMDDCSTEMKVNSLARIPDLLQRGRLAHSNGTLDLQLQNEVYTRYKKLLDVMKDLQALTIGNDSFVSYETATIYQPGYDTARMYGFSLSLCCFYSCMLRGLQLGGPEARLQALELTESVLAFTPILEKFRPLGSSHLFLLQCAAWVCTSDDSKKTVFEQNMEKFRQDFTRSQQTESLRPMLELLSHDLMFGDVNA